MNVMVPLGGIGSRFQKEGYKYPKPFVRVLGKEMILWVIDSLKLRKEDSLVVVYNPAFLDMRELMEMVVQHVPGTILVELPGPTRGAAETVRIGLEGLSASQRSRPTMLVDGDAFYTVDISACTGPSPRKQEAPSASGTRSPSPFIRTSRAYAASEPSLRLMRRGDGVLVGWTYARHDAIAAAA